MMLDTRIIGRDKQLSYSDYLTPSGLNTAQFLPAWQNPQRTILGQEQKTWLISKINGSSSKWQVLGSQVLMGKMYVPVELVPLVAQASSGSIDPAQLLQYSKLLTDLVAIKQRLLQGDPTLTAAEKARVQNVLPFLLDSWDGYPAEREMIYAAVSGKKLISVAGDSHNAWYSYLSNSAGNKVGAEFATASITSPGFEKVLGSIPQALTGFEQGVEVLIDDLQYLDASRKGYVMAIFSANQARAEYRYVPNITVKITSTTTGKTVTES
jgi:alkaline phosphatase D